MRSLMAGSTGLGCSRDCLARTWPATAAAQVQVRVGVPGRATYSELHEGLRRGTPAADSVRAIQRAKVPGPLWRRMRLTVKGRGTGTPR